MQRERPMPRLATFIRENTEQILTEWEAFAGSLPQGDTMDMAALRDHAKEMLAVIARDLEKPQTRDAQAEKAKGASDAGSRDAPNAAQEHGAGRAESGFTMGEMVSEFRALRASVMRLWTRAQGEATAADLEDMTRFNEAIDQAIAESIERFNRDVGQTKDRFLAILGHDLRTPLGAIIMSTQFVLDVGALDDTSRTLVTRMASSARRMNQMVLDLIEFTRTRFGDGVPVQRAAMDVGKTIAAVADEVRASHPQCTLEVETTGDLSGAWDEDRLTQVITNLVTNAVHHGGTALPIRVRAWGDQAEVRISVHNDGPVIPEAELGRIFQLMTRGAETRTRDRRHMGLGLYIVDKIVAGHGGSVHVQSSEATGTTFTVCLPRRA